MRGEVSRCNGETMPALSGFLRKSGAKKKSLSEYANARRNSGAQRISKASSNAQQFENTRDFVSPSCEKVLYTMARALLGLIQEFSRSGRVRHDELKRSIKQGGS
jgi:hypothetical protein